MRFLLDTDAVSSVAEGIGTISSNVASISCSKYNINVDSDDGLDFSSAKNTLVANISACADRIKASQTIINGIIDSHSSLQKSLTFENYLNPPAIPSYTVPNPNCCPQPFYSNGCGRRTA